MRLADIPVKVVAVQPKNYHLKRRLFQALTIALAILVPASGLFRIDPEAGAFVILGRQVWFSDFYLMFGFWIMVATGAVMIYSSVGTVFCGWSCPQNTLSEWANYLTHKLLGKRANVNIESEGLKVAASKNKALNWVILGLSILGISLLFGLIPLFYFYKPDVVWSFVIFRPDARLAKSLHYIYFVCVVIIFLDVAVIRHFWCRYACIYKIWQHTFKTRQTLHVAYDSSRSADCEKCNYCKTSCFLDIDPTKTDIYDSCINCGECIDACDRLHQKEGKKGLLRFEFGERNRSGGFRDNVGDLFSRTSWVGSIFAMGAAIFIWGIFHYSPYNLAAYRSEKARGMTVQEYQIQLSNKLYSEAELTLSVSGLPKGSYLLEKERLNLPPALRQNVNLHIDSDLPKGLYPVVIEARSSDGWVGRFRIEHYSARN